MPAIDSGFWILFIVCILFGGVLAFSTIYGISLLIEWMENKWR